MTDNTHQMLDKPPICRTCLYYVPGVWECDRRKSWNVVCGVISSRRTCESERTRFWRWLGRDTCGPEGLYWIQK